MNKNFDISILEIRKNILLVLESVKDCLRLGDEILSVESKAELIDSIEQILILLNTTDRIFCDTIKEELSKIYQGDGSNIIG